MEQVLYELPEGWAWQTFNDACTNITDGAHASPKTVEDGLPYVTVKDLDNKGQIDTVNCKRISEEDFLSLKKGNCLPPIDSVLLSKDGTVGKVAHVTSDYDEFVVLSSLAIIVPDKQLLSPEYLKYFLLSPEFQDYAIGSKTGAAIKRIVLRTIKNFNIPLAPLYAQKRIVEKLDALLTRIDTAIEHLQESITLADALFKSTMSTLVCSESTDWEKLSLEEVGSFSGGGTPSKSKSEFWNGEILWVTPKDMKFSVITDSELKITQEGVTGSSAKFIPPRSILIVARSGILRHTLPVCINDIECTVNQDIKVFIPSDRVSVEYVQYLLKGYESIILSELVKGGVTVESLKYKEFQNFKFPIPPINEQLDIVQRLTALNDLMEPAKKELNQKVLYLQELKSSILDSAFKGEL